MSKPEFKYPTREIATAWLRERYEEQALLYPRLRDAFTVETYVKVNLHAAMRVTAKDKDTESHETEGTGL